MLMTEYGISSTIVLFGGARIPSPEQKHTARTETLADLSRFYEEARIFARKITERSIADSRVLLVPDLETALEVSNRYAPEHLILQVESPRAWLGHVRNAGSVFLGAWTPETMGDYCSGTNHVLPTYGHARAYSGLGVADFVKRITVQEVTPAGLADLGRTARTLAELESLDAHANAVSVRLAVIERESLK
jgi:histidinol dehydrogenase